MFQLALHWIARLRSRTACAPQAPGGREAGMSVLQRYCPELEEIGERFNVSRLRGEHDRDFSFRIATKIESRLGALQRDLDRVIKLNGR